MGFRYFWVVVLVFVSACAFEDINVDSPSSTNESGLWLDFVAEPKADSCIAERKAEGKIYEENGHLWLKASDNKTGDFNIDDWWLSSCNLTHGLGREFFQALIHPEFEAYNSSDYNESFECLVVYGQGVTKIYPTSLMLHHEIINDEINGHPITVGFCILADLGAVFNPIYCEDTLTFAVSGYTYAEENFWGGITGFLIWDRNTESLWYPQADLAVAGPLQGTSLYKYGIEGQDWEYVSLHEIKTPASEWVVLKAGQTVNPADHYSETGACNLYPE